MRAREFRAQAHHWGLAVSCIWPPDNMFVIRGPAARTEKLKPAPEDDREVYVGIAVHRHRIPLDSLGL